ncbi:reverse transcriptase domain-containing protein [Tanacetum coccineum]
MMASFFQMNTASTLGTGSLPSNTIANPKGELKAITTRSGLVLDGPSVLMPHTFINPEEDERIEETLTDPNLTEFTIKLPPPLVQKANSPSQINYVVYQRDPRHPHIPYPSRMNQEKQQEKDEVQIYKFWQMFKQLHINISLADALILIPKYQKMIKSIISNKEKLIELTNTPLNENCSAVILKKLPKKLGDLGKFLIPCGFSELKCKALADLGASINLMPLSVWKKLGLLELISTRMTLELANREISTPVGIARDVLPVKRPEVEYPVPLHAKACLCCQWSLNDQKQTKTAKYMFVLHLYCAGSGYQQKDRKPSQNDKTEHGMEKTVQNQGQSPKMPKSESILKNQQSNRSRN